MHAMTSWTNPIFEQMHTAVADQVITQFVKLLYCAYMHIDMHIGPWFETLTQCIAMITFGGATLFALIQGGPAQLPEYQQRPIVVFVEHGLYKL